MSINMLVKCISQKRVNPIMIACVSRSCCNLWIRTVLFLVLIVSRSRSQCKLSPMALIQFWSNGRWIKKPWSVLLTLLIVMWRHIDQETSAVCQDSFHPHVEGCRLRDWGSVVSRILFSVVWRHVDQDTVQCVTEDSFNYGVNLWEYQSHQRSS